MRAATRVDTRVTNNKMAVDLEPKVSTADFRVVPLIVPALELMQCHVSS